MTELAIFRIVLSTVLVISIWPEIIDYIVISGEKPLARHLLAEHAGKIGYAIIADSTFFYTQYTGEFALFGFIPAGWAYVFGEAILFTPVIIRRLRS